MKSSAPVLMLALLFPACDKPLQVQGQPKEPPPAAPAPLPDRYSIHEARNGNMISTLMLDKQTGRTWILSKSGTGEDAFQVFDEVGVKPSHPCEEKPPRGNGGCLPAATPAFKPF